MSHSCGNYRLADHFEGRPRAVRELFQRWRDLARACGPITVYAQKTRIVFQARVRFAGAIVHDRWLEAHVWVKRRADHPCVHRVVPLGGLGYAIYFRFECVSDIDEAAAALMREAYADHLTEPASRRRERIGRP